MKIIILLKVKKDLKPVKQPYSCCACNLQPVFQSLSSEEFSNRWVCDTIRYLVPEVCLHRKWKSGTIFQKQPPEVLYKKGVLRNFTKLCLSPATLLKKRLWHRCFPLDFAKFVRTPFLQNNSGRLLLSLLERKSKSEQYKANQQQ